MNAAERRLVVLAIFLLTLGWGVRALPRQWCDQCGDLALVESSEPSRLEHPAPEIVSPDTAITTVPKAKSRQKTKPAAFTGKLPINRASEAELQKLQGVGPTLAHRIVEYRDLHGRFRGGQDLDKVSGIGKKKLDNLLPFLIFD